MIGKMEDGVAGAALEESLQGARSWRRVISMGWRVQGKTRHDKHRSGGNCVAGHDRGSLTAVYTQEGIKRFRMDFSTQMPTAWAVRRLRVLCGAQLWV